MEHQHEYIVSNLRGLTKVKPRKAYLAPLMESTETVTDLGAAGRRGPADLSVRHSPSRSCA